MRNKSNYLRWNEQRRQRNRQFLYEYLLTHLCVDCHEADPVVLQFDHIKGTKRFSVANMTVMGVSLETLQREVAKCVVRCANCHTRKTARERNYFRFKAGNLVVKEKPTEINR